MSAAYDLGGHTALVTGGAGDFGRAVAERLVTSGARVVITDLATAAEGLERTRQECASRAVDAPALVVTGDVTDPSSVEALFDAAVEQVGVPDLVFNNAGVQGLIAPLQDYPLDDMAMVVRVNVEGVFHVLREAGRGCARPVAAGHRQLGLHGRRRGGGQHARFTASRRAPFIASRARPPRTSHRWDPGSMPSRRRSSGPAGCWDLQTARQAGRGRSTTPTDPATCRARDDRRGALAPARLARGVANAVMWLLSDEIVVPDGQNITSAAAI